MSGLFQVPLFADEVTTSWLSRMARANGRYSSNAFCSDLGLSLVAINKGGEEELAKLAGIAGRAFDELASRALQLDTDGYARFAGDKIARRMLRKGKPVGCPVCLQEDERDSKRMPGTRRYQRAAWLLRAIQTCSKHGCELIGFPGTRPCYGLDFCTLLDQADILRQPSAGREASPFELFLYDRLAGRRSHGEHLNRFSITACIDLSVLLGVPALFGRDHGYRDLEEKRRLDAANIGFDILKAGEPAIVELLDRLAAKRKPSGVDGCRSLYGMLYHRLSRSCVGQEFDGVRRIFRQHAISVVPVPSGTTVLGEAVHTPWTTVAEVARQSGVAPSVIRKLMRGGEHGTVETRLIHKDLAEGLVATLEDSVTHDQAAALLGVPRGVFPRFVSAGMINPCGPTVQSSRITGGTKTRYPARDIRKLRQRLIEAADGPVLVQMVSAREAARQTKTSLTLIAGLLLEGRLTASCTESRASLFERICIVPEELLRAVNQVPGLSTQSAAIRIGVSKIAMMRLRDRRIINSQHIKGVRQEVYVFSEGDLRAFEERYVSLGRLSRQLGVHRNRIRQRMRELDMKSAFPREEVQCHLLHRRDTDRLREHLRV